MEFPKPPTGPDWHASFKRRAEQNRLKNGPPKKSHGKKKKKRTREQEAMRMRKRRARYRAEGLTSAGQPVQDPYAQARACRAHHQELCKCHPCRFGRAFGL